MTTATEHRTHDTQELKAVGVEYHFSPSTSDWSDVGGAFRGVPASIAYGGNIFVFTRNTDNTLGFYNVTTNKWRKSGPPTLVSVPSVAPSPNNALAVVALMQSGQIQVSYVDPFGGVSTNFAIIGGQTPIGVKFVGNPVIAVNNNQRVEAFSLDSNGNMWHTFQQSIGNPITWSNWSPLGSGFDTTVLSLAVFQLANTGQLQAVALGSDHNMYQSTQFADGGMDSWSPFAPLGLNAPPQPQFTAGPAANFDSNVQTAVYCGLNLNTGVSSNPLVYLAPSAGFPTWTNFNLLPAQFPVTNAVPVMVNNNGTTQVIWLVPGGQVLFVSEAQTASGFWGDIDNVGNQNGNFTGQMSGVVVGSNVALFQLTKQASLATITYAPGS